MMAANLDEITDEPMETAWTKAVIPLWCLIFIEVTCIGSWVVTTGVPEIRDYSFTHFGNSLVLPRAVTALNTVLITSVCVLHSYVESLVLWMAPQFQMLVKSVPEDDDEESD